MFRAGDVRDVALRCDRLCGTCDPSSTLLDVLAKNDADAIRILNTKLSNSVGLIRGL
jgi:hypothetical protein